MKKPHTFDPNSPAAADSLFGLPFTTDTAKVVVLPVPWEVTVSYRCGTSKGPEAVRKASAQVDLYDEKIIDAWKTGIAMDEIPHKWMKKNKQLRPKAEKYISLYIKQLDSPLKKKELEKMKTLNKEINRACSDLKDWVFSESSALLKKKKIVALLGGDHSTPLGLMQAVSDSCKSFGILHIDAHCDLRNAYEGFTYSHASIMFNALKIKNMTRLVQVGIRDFSDGEAALIKSSGKRIQLFSAQRLNESLFGGDTWAALTNKIISQLPETVYISFDIDGLTPALCPNTGTPVPGGLEYWQAIRLLEAVAESGRRIISFDLNEVAPGIDEWDASVGARLLYKMANIAALTNR
jgi:agmatinase